MQLPLPRTKAVSHAAYAPRRDRGSDRVLARRPGGVRLVVAGRRPGSPAVLPRRRRVRRGSAPRHRRRWRGRRTGARARRRQRVVRRLGPGRRTSPDDPDRRRLRRDAAPARVGRRRPRRRRRGGRGRRPRRPERGPGQRRSARSPRRSPGLRSRGLRRPGRAAAGAHPGGFARPCADTGARAGRRTGSDVGPGTERRAGDAPGGRSRRGGADRRRRRSCACSGDRGGPPRGSVSNDGSPEVRDVDGRACAACRQASSPRSLRPGGVRPRAGTERAGWAAPRRAGGRGSPSTAADGAPSQAGVDTARRGRPAGRLACDRDRAGRDATRRPAASAASRLGAARIALTPGPATRRSAAAPGRARRRGGRARGQGRAEGCTYH